MVPPARAALTLMLLAGIAAAALSLLHEGLSVRTARNEAGALRERLALLLARVEHDNDVAADRIVVQAAALGGEPGSVYRARRAGAPAAMVLELTAPGGYNGPLRLLLAVSPAGRVLGLELLAHRETPGLGDRVDPRRSSWFSGLLGRGIGDPPLPRWRVRKDGGDFDQLSGATITPRAMVNAVARCLQFHARHRGVLYGAPAGAWLEEGVLSKRSASAAGPQDLRNTQRSQAGARP